MTKQVGKILVASSFHHWGIQRMRKATVSVTCLLLMACGSGSKSEISLSTDGTLEVAAGPDNSGREGAVLEVSAGEGDCCTLHEVLFDAETAEEVLDSTAPGDGQVADAGPPDYLPPTLPLVWSNLADRDMVTVRKKIVLEFEQGTRMPQNADEEYWYNKVFEPTLTLWDADSGAVGEVVETTLTWRHEKEGMFRRPALIVEAAPCTSAEQPGCPFDADVPQFLPSTAYRLTAWLGDQILDRVFHTIPAWAPGYKVIDSWEVPVPTDCEQFCDGDCARCFPFPVRIHVFVPPEYDSVDEALNNTSLPWNNKNQRYPVLVGLHGYNGQGGSMYDAYGHSTLPRFTAQGVVEPTILVLTDGTVPQPHCGGGWPWPGTSGNTCYTQFLGIGADVPNDTSFVSYSFWLAWTMRQYLATKVRLRGWDDQGNVVDEEAARRAYGITGLSGGGWGALNNAFLFPEAYGNVYGLMPTTVSIFNPYAYFYTNGVLPISHDQICNKQTNSNYPYEPVGDGFRDLSMIAPETTTVCPAGQVCKWPQGYCLPEAECEGSCHNDAPCPSTGLTQQVIMELREIIAGAQSCFWWSPPPVSSLIVESLLCGIDVTCSVDPDAPDIFRVDFDKYPFDGNILFSTGIRDFEGPPAAFMDLDQQLDKRGVLHSFRYEDRGGVYHDWQAIYDQVVGRYEVPWQDGTESPGNYPGTGMLYPFVNNAFEGLGNHPFNHPFASEFTTGALDPDRDFYIDCIYESAPELNFVEDNCPGIYNPDQADSDGDGVGNACDS